MAAIPKKRIMKIQQTLSVILETVYFLGDYQTVSSKQIFNGEIRKRWGGKKENKLQCKLLMYIKKEN